MAALESQLRKPEKMYELIIGTQELKMERRLKEGLLGVERRIRMGRVFYVSTF